MDLKTSSRDEKEQILKWLEEYDTRFKSNKLKLMFPDKGPLSRDKYGKHIKFFDAGNSFVERAFIGGNRTGKSVAGGFETTVHATGLYPPWWTGVKFYEPTDIWVAGLTTDFVRETIQNVLLGNIRDMGTGLIPKHLINGNVVKLPGSSDCVQTVYVDHISGGVSTVTFKSYAQEREAFQGTSRHFIWLDEECPKDIYSECLARTMTVGGRVILTFTPLKGLTDTVLSFLPGGLFPRTLDKCGPVEGK